jgi:hypothetical protein
MNREREGSRRKSRIGKGEGNREKRGKGIRGQEQGEKSKEMRALAQGIEWRKNMKEREIKQGKATRRIKKGREKAGQNGEYLGNRKERRSIGLEQRRYWRGTGEVGGV